MYKYMEEQKYTDGDETLKDKIKKSYKKNAEKSKKIGREVLEWVLCFVIAYVIYLNINFFIGTISGVKQVSMIPTAKENERVLIQSTTIFKKDLKHGDIITFEAPIDKLNKDDYDASNLIAEYKDYKGLNNFLYSFVGIGKVTYIKRIIGLPGDHIVISEDGNVYRNDERLVENYLNDDTTNISGVYSDLVVPEGTIFAMGDNRLQSKDSRVFGCVPISRVNGYVITRVWPLNKMGAL